MKIGLVSTPLSVPGGIREHALALASFLRKKGQPVKIIAPPGGKGERSSANSLVLGRSVPIPINASWHFLGASLRPGEIEAVLAEENFDLLHFHGGGLLQAQILERSAAVNVLTLHANPEGSFIFSNLPSLLRVVEAWAADKIHGLLAVSRSAARLWPDFKGPFEIIPNGVDLSRFNRRVGRRKEFLDGKTNILFVGRLDKRKGLPFLIEAFSLLRRQHPRLRLIVVGEGSEGKRCRAKVRREEIPDVEFVGFVADESLPSYYATADIFCSPATHAESFGIVLLEAMASGKPVVAFANAGYREVLTGLGREFLVPVGDVGALAAALGKLVANEGLRSALGRWGVGEAKKYSWESVGEKVFNFYKKVCLSRGKRFELEVEPSFRRPKRAKRGVGGGEPCG